jgi:hypothetical protein
MYITKYLPSCSETGSSPLSFGACCNIGSSPWNVEPAVCEKKNIVKNKSMING